MKDVNDNLFKPLDKDEQIKSLKKELKKEYYYKIQKIEKLVNALNNDEPYKYILKDVNFIDGICEQIGRTIDYLKYKDDETENDRKI